MRTNYHTHSPFCDGKASIPAMAAAAQAVGYQVLGFSSHAPLPFETTWNMKASQMPEYAQSVREEARAWKERGFEILLGLEIDWIEGIASPCDARFDSIDLDFRICSVHFIDPAGSGLFTVDSPSDEFEESAAAAVGGEGDRLWKDYYRRLGLAIEEGGFDILGHLDLVVRNNRNGRWFDESSKAYLDAAFEAIEPMGTSGAVAEINIGPLVRGKSDRPHPSMPIMKRLHELGVPVTISADAHDTPHFGKRLDDARDLARNAGYRSVAVLSGGSWREVGLEET
ncbi:MAG: histidinol-phosphatase [Spirochaetota bacterium]